MATVSVTGLPALAWGIGFVVIGAAPVWLAAKATGAGNPTLGRSILSLLLGTIASGACLIFGGAIGMFLVPIAYLVAFKFILDTSLLGSMLLGILALVGYFLIAKFLGGGLDVSA